MICVTLALEPKVLAFTQHKDLALALNLVV